MIIRSASRLLATPAPETKSQEPPLSAPLPRVGAGVIGAAQRSIGELRDEISRVALKSPVKAKELASSREMEEHRQAALVRLVGETQDLLGAAQAKRIMVVDAAIEAERALWDREISAHVDAIERLAAEMYNRREAILKAGTARYDCYNRLKGLLPRAPQEPELPLKLGLTGTNRGVGLGEAIGETIRRQGGGDDD